MELPWTLPKVDRRSARLASAVAGTVAGWRRPRLLVRRHGTEIVVEQPARIAADRYRLVDARVMAPAALAARLVDPTTGVAVLRAGGWRGFVVAPARAVRALAQEVLGGPDEVAAPRPLTIAERAVLVAAIAAALADLELAVEVEPSELGGPQLAAAIAAGAAVLEVEVAGRGQVAIVLPAAAVTAPARRPLDELAAAARWLDVAYVAPVVVADTRLERVAIAGLRVRDVVTVSPAAGPGEVAVRVGRGGVRAALHPASGRVTVVAPYHRGAMDETLGDDATVDVAIAIGDVRLTVRGVLELAPGQVLELGRAPGGAVELRVGTRVVARGELVDVDGELGVRVISVG